MIAVVGDPGPRAASSTEARKIAASAVAAGSRVQAVGIAGPDVRGDEVLLALTREGVGHAAILRTSRPTMEAADVALALRYLTDTKVIVLVDLDDALIGAAAEGASWSGARIVAVVGPSGAAGQRRARGAATSGASGTTNLPDDAIVFEAPASDPDGTFAGFVGELAARLDRGEEPRAAWEAAVRSKAVDAIGPRPR